jgi:hypothetical protein
MKADTKMRDTKTLDKMIWKSWKGDTRKSWKGDTRKSWKEDTMEEDK